MLAAQQVFCKPKIGSSILSVGTRFFNDFRDMDLIELPVMLLSCNASRGRLTEAALITTLTDPKVPMSVSTFAAAGRAVEHMC